MAKRSEIFSLWFPLGVGALICGATLRWPDLGGELMAVGGGVIVASLAFYWFTGLIAVIAGLLAGFIVFAGFSVADRYWPSLEKPSVGSRIEFQGIHVDRKGESDQMTIHLNNTSDFPAAAVAAGASIFTSHLSNIADNRDVKDGALLVLEDLRKRQLILGHGMQITRGMGIELQMDRPHGDIEAVESGQNYLYIVVISKSLVRNLPATKAWISETCALIVRPYTGFQSCPDYNDYFIGDATTLRRDAP